MPSNRSWVYHWIWIPLLVPVALFLAKEIYSAWVAPGLFGSTASQGNATPATSPVTPNGSSPANAPQNAAPRVPADKPPTIIDD